MNSQKLKIKDIIMVTLLTLINVLIFMLGSLLYVTPVTILMMPVIFALVEGIVFFTIGVKIPKRGALFIYCAIRGIMGGYLPYIICYLIAGVIAELIVAKSGYGKSGGLSISYIITEALSAIGGMFYPYVIAYKSFFKNADELIREGNNKNVYDAANMIQSWRSLILVAAIIVAAFIGTLIAKRMMKKHLLKAEENV